MNHWPGFADANNTANSASITTAYMLSCLWSNKQWHEPSSKHSYGEEKEYAWGWLTHCDECFKSTSALCRRVLPVDNRSVRTSSTMLYSYMYTWLMCVGFNNFFFNVLHWFVLHFFIQYSVIAIIMVRSATRDVRLGPCFTKTCRGYVGSLPGVLLSWDGKRRNRSAGSLWKDARTFHTNRQGSEWHDKQCNTVQRYYPTQQI